jgi:hypothetical protein
MIPAGQLSACFLAVVEWALAAGAQQIERLPGCWEGAIDAEWSVALNGHAAPMPDSRGNLVPVWSARVYRDGEPAACLALREGVALPGVEDALITACEAAKLRLMVLDA